VGFFSASLRPCVFAFFSRKSSNMTSRRLRTMMITSDTSEDRLLVQVERALGAGVDYVQLRRRDIAAGELQSLAKRLVGLSARSREALLVNGRLDVALSSHAKGVHLPARGLPTEAVLRVAPPGFIVSRSTHRGEEVESAREQGANFVVFGPVFPTRSKPGHPGVGLAALAAAVSSAPIPVYALGGITPERISAIEDTGAQGIAGISVFEDEESLRALLDRLERS